jgi:two-component sensor histidine kinase
VTDSAPRILYVDDDEGLRRLTSRALQRQGFVVTTAADGAEGVRLCAAEPFDLVAVDHYMPGMDGLETLAALQALPSTPPVIYVTGSDESRLAVAALKAGAIDYVVKTVNDDFFDLLGKSIAQGIAAVRLRHAKERAEQQLRETNERLEAMLQEVNHRVANSLQLVSSFVHLQSRALQDEGARAALADTQRRIAAIAQVHKFLYRSDNVGIVDMADYLSALVEELSGTWSTPTAPRTISLTAEPTLVPTDKAVSIGIIVTELVTNACKYAYPEGGGEVRVAFRGTDAHELCLTVEDDGRGMTGDTAKGAAQGTGIGTKLIQAMAASLRATIGYEDTRPGVRATLCVSVDAPREVLA